MSPSKLGARGSAAGGDRSKAREARGRGLALVVGDEGVERADVNRGGDVDRVKRSEGGFAR